MHGSGEGRVPRDRPVKASVGIPGSGGLHKERVEMGLEVMDGDEGFAVRPGECLGRLDAHQEAADEAGAARDGDGLDVVPGSAGLFESRVDHRQAGFEVLARGDLRDDAAEAGVEFGLARDEIDGGSAFAVDQRTGGLVAGGFDAEDILC